MNDKVQYWLDIAEYDLDTAQAMLDTKRYLYVGFMCHQVIEKAFKAVIADKNEFPPKIHNLPTLADKANITKKLSSNQMKFISDLNPLNIESRYPRYTEKINAMLTQDKCKNIIKETEDLFIWIKTFLQK